MGFLKDKMTIEGAGVRMYMQVVTGERKSPRDKKLRSKVVFSEEVPKVVGPRGYHRIFNDFTYESVIEWFDTEAQARARFNAVMPDMVRRYQELKTSHGYTDHQ